MLCVLVFSLRIICRSGPFSPKLFVFKDEGRDLGKQSAYWQLSLPIGCSSVFTGYDLLELIPQLWLSIEWEWVLQVSSFGWLHKSHSSSLSSSKWHAQLFTSHFVEGRTLICKWLSAALVWVLGIAWKIYPLAENARVPRCNCIDLAAPFPTSRLPGSANSRI